ncbi:autotransporter domain-containing protein, partial [Malaciobacter molluscorum]|uniref:autotransporter outer membrane beta-barrel domain-containing protein n=1 Tax=Malaciobacter molluscorum TaxID=1032072 RepID=UPI0010264313
YARYAMNKAFLDFALLAGGSSNDVKRTMTYNLASGGYDYARANYTGWFTSPELAYGVKQDLAKNWTVTPTARVRYLGANFGSYQESGSANNLTVAGRTTHNFEERGELVFTRTTSEREGSVLQINATIGALAWQRAGDGGLNT